MAEPEPQKENEEQYELPDGWIWVRLSDVINDFQPGFACGARDDRGYVQLRMNNIGLDGRVVLEKTLKVPIEKTNMGKYNLRMGDILFNNTNSVELIGKTALFRDEVQKCVFSNHITRIRSDTRLINSKYLLNVFINGYNRGIFQMMCHRFVGQAGISRKKLLEHTFPLPPLHEQHRIVTKLETLLAQVNRSKDHLAKVPPLIKRFRQSVLAAACSGRLTEDWRREHPDVEPASELLNRIREERIRRYDEECRKAELEGRRKPKKLYDIRINVGPENHNDVYLPSTWKAGYINDIGNVCNGSTPSRKEQKFWKGDIPWISSGEVANNIICSTREKITEIGFKNASLRLLPKGTVLLAMIGEGKTRGQSAILNIEATINQNIAAILIDHFQLSPRYLQSWFQFQYLSTRETGSGSGPKALNCQRVRNIPFNLPPLPEQHAIVERLETLFHFADEVEQRVAAATTNANHLSQSILARAFRGELVPQDPHDEPASVLLERIKQERAELKEKKKTQKIKSKTMLDFN